MVYKYVLNCGKLSFPFVFILIAIITIPASNALAEPSLHHLIYQFLSSGENLNYRGIQVIMKGFRDPQPYAIKRKIIHTKNNHVLIEDIYPSSRRGAIIVDDSVWKKSLEPGSKSIKLIRSSWLRNRPDDILKHVRLIQNNYAIRMKGVETMARRKCWRICMTPYTHTKSTINVWIDKKTGLTLCHQESDSRGNTIGLSFFSNIQFPQHIPDKQVSYRFSDKLQREVISRSITYTSLASLKKKAPFSVYQPVQMPDGYLFDECEMSCILGRATACLRYTDGISNITICETPAIICRPPSFTQIQTGVRSNRDYIISYSTSTMDFVVMGSEPISSLIEIAQQLDGQREHICRSRILYMYPHSLPDIRSFRNLGLCMDGVSAAMLLSARLHKSPELFASLMSRGYSWQSIARDYHLNLESMQQSIHNVMR
jgi:negative regulator of sigma E activity